MECSDSESPLTIGHHRYQTLTLGLLVQHPHILFITRGSVPYSLGNTSMCAQDKKPMHSSKQYSSNPCRDWIDHHHLRDSAQTHMSS